MCTHHGARGEGKLRLQEVGSRYLNLFVFFYQITVHVPMKSQVIGICGDAVPRAVQKDALTLADTRPAANTSPSRSAAHRNGWLSAWPATAGMGPRPSSPKALR